MQVSFKTGKNQGDSGTKLSPGANEKSGSRNRELRTMKKERGSFLPVNKH